MCKTPPEGFEWPAPWEPIPPGDTCLGYPRITAEVFGRESPADTLSQELQREVSPAHPLYQAVCSAVGRNREDPNEFLFLTDHPRMPLAVIVGLVSKGLRVRDFDDKDSYMVWSEQHSDLSVSLPTVRTHRGFHVYFRADLPDKVIPFEDGELRAGNGIVVLPPSLHPSGSRYEWVNPPLDEIPFIADVPGAGLFGVCSSQNESMSIPPEVADAITKTLPTGYGERNDKIFSFVRRLKGLHNIDKSAPALSSYIWNWHQRALPFIKTKCFGETELAFYLAWKNSKIPLSDTQLRSLLQPYLQGPNPEWLKTFNFPETGKRLLRICAALQNHNGPEPFFLAARAAGSVLNIDATLASRLLTELTKEGYLEKVLIGTMKTKLATTYRYIGPPIPCTTEPAMAM